MKIAYYVHGRGRGHAARALRLIPKLLKDGHEIDIFTSDDATSLLAPYVPTIIKRDRNIWTFLPRIFSDYHNLKKTVPQLVISDGDAPAVYAARLLGIRTISIGHGLIIPYCLHPFSLPWRAYFQESLKSIFNSYFAHRRVAVHFTHIVPKNKTTIVARPDAIDDSPKERGNYYISYFRDHVGSSIVRELVNAGYTVHNFGHPVHIEGVLNHSIERELFKYYLLRSKGVVGTAGSNLIYEAAILNKPLLCVYQNHDFEQWINSKYVETERIGLAVEKSMIDATVIETFLKLDAGKTNNNMVSQLPQLSDVVLDLL